MSKICQSDPNSITLILPQTKFEAIPSKDAGRDAFLAEANVLSQVSDFGRNNVSPMVPMDLIIEFLEFQ